MPTVEPLKPFSATFQATLTSLAEQHKDAGAKEKRLLKTRKLLENDLNEMGSDEGTVKGAKYKNTASAFTFNERAITQVRDEIKYLAETVFELLLDAKHGKFWDDAELEGRTNRKDGPAMPLFDRAMAMAGAVNPEAAKVGEPDEDAAKRDKGKGVEAAPGSTAAGESDEAPTEVARKTWRMLAVSVIKGLTHDCVKALQDVGLMNLNDLDKFIHEENRSLATIDGFCRADSAKVHDELAKWKKLDAEAEAKEKAAETTPAPSSNGKPPKPRKTKAATAS